ncbi:MAG: hypothetical protein C0412_17470, partial [Flavobacterium sp.]|nr:hypothetical protein [Flavobacterium sp.]
GLINSWDKITSRCAVRLLPDYLMVHNDIIKKEALDHIDMKKERIKVVGIPHYDIFVNSKPSPKEEFYKSIGADINKKILLFCPVGKFYSDLDVEMINIISDFQIKNSIPANTQILVRFPPNDTVDTSNIKNKEVVIFEQPGKMFSVQRGIDWDMNNTDNQHLLDTLYYSSLVICPPSSISVDAAVFNKPIINIKFKRTGKKYANQNINLFYDSDHYKKLIDTSGVKIVNNKVELLYWINKYLNNPEIDYQGRKLIIKEQCWKLDGQSGKRVADFLLSLCLGVV